MDRSSASILSDTYEQCRATADWLLANTQVRPTVGIVCGSGLGGLAEMIKDPQVFKYSDIPHFPRSTGLHKQRLLAAVTACRVCLSSLIRCVCVFML